MIEEYHYGISSEDFERQLDTDIGLAMWYTEIADKGWEWTPKLWVDLGSTWAALHIGPRWYQIWLGGYGFTFYRGMYKWLFVPKWRGRWSF